MSASATHTSNASAVPRLRDSLQLLSPFQFQWAIGAFASACLPTLLWLQWQISVAMICVLGLRLYSARRNPKAWPGWIRVLLTIAGVLLVLASYGSIVGRAPGGALLVLMMTLKCTESASLRDARALATVSFFVIIASFLMDQGPIATCLAGFATLCCFGALEVLVRPAISGTHSPFARMSSGNVVGLLLLALPMALALWLLFPRLATPLWGTAESGQSRSGLSDTVKPNSFSDLLLDDSPVMRLRFENGQRPQPNSLYFRGYVLWSIETDGTWKGANYYREQYGKRPSPSAQDLSYQVVLEPTDQRQLYVADEGVSVSEESIFFNNERRFIRSLPISDLLRYQARSNLSDRITERLDGDSKSWLHRIATELPEQLNPRTRELGASLKKRFGEDRAAIVSEVLRMFREGAYRYTLSPTDTLGINTTDQFLFATQDGYCQHYASAFAWILRAANVPTRLVVGYAGGRYYGLDSNDPYLLITQERAHAWNEVLIGKQWLRIDPTAEIPPERIDEAARNAFSESETGLLASLKSIRETMADWWNNTVLNFNADRQKNLLKPFGIESADWKQLTAALVAALALSTLVWSAWLLFQQRRAKAHPIQAEFDALLKRATRYGLIRAPQESAQSLGRRASETQQPWSAEFKAICLEYTALCYEKSIEEHAPEVQQRFAQRCRALKFRSH